MNIWLHFSPAAAVAVVVVAHGAGHSANKCHLSYTSSSWHERMHHTGHNDAPYAARDR